MDRREKNPEGRKSHEVHRLRETRCEGPQRMGGDGKGGTRGQHQSRNMDVCHAWATDSGIVVHLPEKGTEEISLGLGVRQHRVHMGGAAKKRIGEASMYPHGGEAEASRIAGLWEDTWGSVKQLEWK